MKHFSVALIVVALIAADFCSDMWLTDKEAQAGWDLANTLGLIGAAVWFIYHATLDLKG